MCKQCKFSLSNSAKFSNLILNCSSWDLNCQSERIFSFCTFYYTFQTICKLLIILLQKTITEMFHWVYIQKLHRPPTYANLTRQICKLEIYKLLCIWIVLDQAMFLDWTLGLSRKEMPSPIVHTIIWNSNGFLTIFPRNPDWGENKSWFWVLCGFFSGNPC